MRYESWLPSLWSGREGNADPFKQLRSQLDTMLDDWARPMAASANHAVVPRIDVSETDKEITVTAEMPGVEQKDIDVTLIGDVLTIKGQKKSEKDEKKEGDGRVYHRTERSYGVYQRSMSVPRGLDPAKVSATFKDGVLSVSLPKPAEAEASSKRIEVKSST